MGNSGSQDFSLNTDYRLTYTERTLYNNISGRTGEGHSTLGHNA